MIRRVWFENLGPFRKRVDLDLARQGFVLIKGKNKISAALDANGVGKTSIPNGIAWILFGEDLNGRKADAVANRFTDETCIGGMELEDDKGVWTIERMRRPGRLSVMGIDGIAENEDMALIQERIEQRLGFGLRTFKNAIVFGQGTFERFASAGQTEQMRMLDEIQGIDFGDELKRAKEWRTDLQAKAQAINTEIETRQARREATERAITSLEAARARHEQDRADRLTRLALAKQAAQGRQMVAESGLQAATDAGTALPVLAEAKKMSYDALVIASTAKDTQTRSDRAHDTTEQAAQVAQNAVFQFVERLDRLIAAGKCPTCRQAVQDTARALFQPELDALGQKAKDADTAEQAAHWRAKTDREAAAQTKQTYEQAYVAFRALAPAGVDPEAYIGTLQGKVKEIEQRKRAMAEAETEISRINRDIDAENTAVRTGQDELNKMLATVRDLGEQEKAAIGRAEKLRSALAMAEYWVEAFGDRGIRSIMVDGVADYVNDRLVAHLDDLAAGEATTVMSAQTELKKGGAKEKISFKTEWKWGGNGPADGSGGQDRRKDLALFAAMQDLAELRSARPFPFKVFDEPFDALDGRGKELACAWMKKMATERGTVLLMTHSDDVITNAEPDKVWTVVMDEDGAHVEVS